MSTFSVKILACDKTFFDGEVESLTLPATDGEFCILPHHENTIIAIGNGIMRFRVPGGEVTEAVVTSGFVEVVNNQVRVLVQTIERADEIDKVRAQRAKEKAEEKLKYEKDRISRMHAEASLNRALLRLKTAK